MDIIEEASSNAVTSIEQAIKNKLKELLENKHLYQSVRIDFIGIQQSLSEKFKASSEDFNKEKSISSLPHSRPSFDAHKICLEAIVGECKKIIKKN